MIGTEYIKDICELVTSSREVSWQSEGLVDTIFWHPHMLTCL